MHYNNSSQRIGFAGGSSLAVVLILVLTGCASYNTPGGPADFRALGITAEEVEEQTDFGILQQLERRPLASFPANIAVARVQAPRYRSHTARGHGQGRYSVVTTRDVEQDEHFEQLRGLPMVRGLAPLNRLVLPQRLNSEEDLREAAASVQAEMLLIYTFDTEFTTESKVAPLAVITIGLFPERQARVATTASAALLDTRNGYVYGLAEASSRTTQIASAWTSKAAVDQSRRRVESDAFGKLVDEVAGMWQRVASEYGPSETPLPRNLPAQTLPADETGEAG